jgi:CHAD domain-containing protein
MGHPSFCICRRRKNDVLFSTVANAKPASVSPAEWTTRLLALLHRLSADASKKDVHALRTTVRRLEVQLGTPPPKIAKALKKLRKRGGKVRDLDVHLGLLKAPLPLAHGKRPGAASQTSQAQDKLRKVLKRKRERRSDTLREVVDDSLPLLESRLPAVAAEHVARPVSLHDARQRASRARRRFLQWTRHIPDDEQRLHELRIRTKKLRYEMEPLAHCEEAAELVEKFKQVQDAIGDWHDWLTLAALAADRFGSPKASSQAGLFCDALRARAAREYRKARRSAETVRSWMTGSRPAAPAGADTGPRLVRKAG